jgi:hypothetical protein
MLFTIARFLLILLLILAPLLYAAPPRVSLSPLSQVLVYLSATLGLLLFLYELLKGGGSGGESETNLLYRGTYDEVKRLSALHKSTSQQVHNMYQTMQNSPNLDSLRDELHAEQEKSKEYFQRLTDAQDSALDSERCIQELEAELQKRLIEASELGKQLAHVHDELEVLRKSQEARLSQVLPAELLASEVGDTVRWASEAATQQDVIAANLFASLQSLFASQLDTDASGQSLDYLPALGKALSKMATRAGWSSSKRHEMFSCWARVLNSLSRNDFTLYVPDIGARVRNDTMNGLHEGTVSEVRCWGVRNHKQGIAYMAEVG